MGISRDRGLAARHAGCNAVKERQRRELSFDTYVMGSPDNRGCGDGSRSDDARGPGAPVVRGYR